jgi:hypothetical protein
MDLTAITCFLKILRFVASAHCSICSASLCFQSHDVLESGPPPKGSEIQVRWPDGQLYPGTFVGTNTVDMFMVWLSSRSVTPSCVYLLIGLLWRWFWIDSETWRCLVTWWGNATEGSHPTGEELLF